MRAAPDRGWETEPRAVPEVNPAGSRWAPPRFPPAPPASPPGPGGTPSGSHPGSISLRRYLRACYCYAVAVRDQAGGFGDGNLTPETIRRLGALHAALAAREPRLWGPYPAPAPPSLAAVKRLALRWLDEAGSAEHPDRRRLREVLEAIAPEAFVREALGHVRAAVALQQGSPSTTCYREWVLDPLFALLFAIDVVDRCCGSGGALWELDRIGFTVVDWDNQPPAQADLEP